jgi:hypothetical protein
MSPRRSHSSFFKTLTFNQVIEFEHLRVEVNVSATTIYYLNIEGFKMASSRQ